jgi:hypothetical protein
VKGLTPVMPKGAMYMMVSEITYIKMHVIVVTELKPEN